MNFTTAAAATLEGRYYKMEGLKQFQFKLKHRIRMFNQGNCRPILCPFDKTYFQAALFQNKYFLNFTIAHLSQTSPFT